MKILQIHNKYKLYGGEDAVLNNEFELLKKYENDVEQLIFDNISIDSFWSKFTLLFKSIYNFSSANRLKNKIADFKPDIIHVHNFFPICSPSVFNVAKKHNIPVVLTLHNYRLICANAELVRNNKPCFDCIQKTFPLNGVRHSCYRTSKLQSFVVTLMASFHKMKGTWHTKVDGYIALTNYSKKLFIQSSLKLNPNKIFIKPNFINTHSFADVNILRNDNYLFVGRLIDSKGIKNLLHATELFNFKLTIIGDGPLLNEVLTFAKKNPNITFLGFQSQEYILKELSQCRALIFPSVKVEGFPVTIVESFSTGTPVISFDSGPLKDIVKNKYNGYIYKNTEELISILKDFETNIEKHKILYLNAQNTFNENYTPQKNYETLINIYNSLISRKENEWSSKIL